MPANSRWDLIRRLRVNATQSLGLETRRKCFVTNMYLFSCSELSMPFNVM